MIVKVKSALVLFLISVSTAAVLASPLGTTFTYQGQLKDAGAPANGNYDFQFTLHDGINPIATQTIADWPVSNGLFTVVLDFGSTAFTGQRRWLEIGVRPGGSVGVYTILSPRQELTAAPYGLYALSAASATAAGNADTLDGQHGNWYQNASNITVGNVGVARLPTGGNWDLTSNLTFESSLLALDVTNARVGIGTTAPNSQLHINCDPNETALRVQVSGASKLVVAPNGGVSVGVNATPPVNGLYVEGNVGIGDLSPSAKLEVVSTATTGYGMRVANSAAGLDNAALRVENTGTAGFGIRCDAAGSGTTLVLGNNGTGRLIEGFSDGGQLHFKVEHDGTTTVRVLEVTGADLAEKFPVSEKLEPGMVVEIDANHPGQLCLSREAYNRRVAGVVSGAGGLPAGAILGNLPENKDGPPIAMSGRVWVFCDAGNSAIQPGDLLTTAEKPGHAMKATDYPRAQGAIIGKAMTRLNAGETGLVLVLVGLQ